MKTTAIKSSVLILIILSSCASYRISEQKGYDGYHGNVFNKKEARKIVKEKDLEKVTLGYTVDRRNGKKDRTIPTWESIEIFETENQAKGRLTELIESN